MHALYLPAHARSQSIACVCSIQARQRCAQGQYEVERLHE